ncbi:MAG: hypothetical protein ACM3IJ_06230 [Candidatus Levyibacteriota bacterium]
MTSIEKRSIREIPRPFSQELVMGLGMSIVVDDLFSLTLGTPERRDKRLLLLIGCSKSISILRESSLEKEGAWEKKPEPGFGLLTIRISDQEGRKSIYVGEDYEIRCMKMEQEKAKIKIFSTSPVGLTALENGENVLEYVERIRGILEGTLRN